VPDSINGGWFDFRAWSRKRVDNKFLADMRRLCTRAIPARAKTALEDCKARGGNVSIGAQSRYNAVCLVGAANFDANLTKPGTQPTGHRVNY
jgi:hypothetical protein